MAALTRDPAPTPTSTRELEPAPDPDNRGGSGDANVLSLLRVRDRMKEQLMEYNTAILASQENVLDHAGEEKFIKSATKNLQKDTAKVKVSLQNKTLALQRIQIMESLRNKLKQDDEDSRLILETMKQIALLSRKVVEYQQQAHQKEQQLIDIKRKRLSLQKDGGQKIKQVHTMMKRQKEKEAIENVTETEKMLDKLEKERQMTTIIQNVFQNIIIGSRVNWAEDPSLKAIVLQLEENVCLH